MSRMIEPETRQFYEHLGARIRQLRRHRLSQEKLAEAAGLSRASIVNIEGGRQRLLVHNLFEIARVLNVTPSELIAPIEPKTITDIDQNVAGNDFEWILRSLTQIQEAKAIQ